MVLNQYYPESAFNIKRPIPSYVYRKVKNIITIKNAENILAQNIQLFIQRLFVLDVNI